MTLSSRSTLFILGAIAIVIVAIVTWAVRSSWLSSHHLQALHTTLAAQANDLPDDAQVLLTRMNSLLLASVLGPSNEDEEFSEEFEAAAAELRERLAAEPVAVSDSRGESLAAAVSRQFEEYYSAARELMEESPEAVDPAQRFARIQATRERAEVIIGELSRASQISDEALEATFTSYHSGYSRLALLLILLPGLCIALAGATIFVALQNHMNSLRLDLSRAKLDQAKQEKLASLGTMASGVAHEIRNPLTAIKARLFVLERRLGSNPEARSQAVEIGKEINRLDRIVKEFLMFGRPAEPVLATVEVSGLLRQVEDLLRRELEDRQVALTVSPAEGLRARGDGEQIKQVLINLIQNAADASKPGDEIKLVAEGLSGGAKGASCRRVAVRVIDQGSGVPREHAGNLFNPFYTGKPTGVGLGLSIAKRIAQNHDGDIVFESIEGEGSTFSLILPAADSPA